MMGVSTNSYHPMALGQSWQWTHQQATTPEFSAPSNAGNNEHEHNLPKRIVFPSKIDANARVGGHSLLPVVIFPRFMSNPKQEISQNSAQDRRNNIDEAVRRGHCIMYGLRKKPVPFSQLNQYLLYGTLYESFHLLMEPCLTVC